MLTLKIKLRIFFWIILALVIAGLLYCGLAPTGQMTYIKNFTHDNYFVSKLTPEDRVLPAINGVQNIIGDPAYFTLHTLRPFDTAKLTITYKNNDKKIIEAGALMDKSVWRYDLQPIENKYLEDYLKTWPSVRDGQTILLERPAEAISISPLKYGSIFEFLSNPPAVNEIALYNYDLKRDFDLPDYVASPSENDLGLSLRGAYQFYIYIKNEDPDLVFSFSDLNKNKDSDNIDINIYSQNKLVGSWHQVDPSAPTDNGHLESRGEVKINPTKLASGVYKVEVKANDDIITDKIRTKQSKLVFINKIWLADKNRKDLAFFTDSSIVNAQTVNPGRLQTIKVGSDDLKIAETYKQYSLETKNSTNLIKIPKDDLILSGDGVFAVDQASFFNPDFKKVGPNFHDQGIRYILANYNPVSEENSWKKATAEFDLKNAYSEPEDSVVSYLGHGPRKYSFLISVPGLRADDNISDQIEINQIKIELTGTSLLNKLMNILPK